MPEPFREDDPQALHEFMRAFPFATLVSSADAIPQVTHLPMVFDAAAGSLRGHMARANPHWKTLGVDTPALAIFLGPHAYVSPQWYPSKQAGGKVVPTWNYVAVHAHGRLRVVEDAGWLRANVTALTDQQEASFPAPWKVDDAPEDYAAKMLAAIVGVELTVTRLIGKWKLSQNKPAADHDGVREGLAAQGGTNKDVADLMKR
ncbi:MAG: FMN-binding negative transcriptional regulator [Rhodospirillaceae bacterium]